jgi:Uma2 family endonuclease
MVNLAYDYHLPTAEELPDSDDTPVDNQLQNDIPNFLLNLLYLIWAERQDWYFGIDMGIYHDPNSNIPIVPDGFLALGVERHKAEGGRLSYVLWEECDEMPKLVLEVVSQTYNGEYDTKMQGYQGLGVLYYVVYNPLSGRRGTYKRRQSLEVYKLVSGTYQLQTGNPVIWLPEIGLGIGCEQGTLGGWRREWIYWYDENGHRYPTSDELTAQEKLAKEQAEAIALQEKQRADRMADRLISLGINLDEI